MKFILLIFLLMSSFASAQDLIQLEGKVLARSGKPIPYASISIKNSSLGTVTNSSGDFEFFVPSTQRKDSILVSHIGYKTFKERITNLNVGIVYLDESPTLLNEVIVSAVDAMKLVEQASVTIPSIYPTTPYLMEGFHRSWEKVDFTDSISYPGTLIEAAVTIYDPGYTDVKSRKKREEEVFINEVRRSRVKKGWSYNSSALNHLLKRNLVKYDEEPAWNFLRSFLKFPNDLEFELEGETYIDDEPVSIVRAEIPNSLKFPAYVRIYISSADNAILRFDLSGEKVEIDYSLGPWHTRHLMETFVFSRYQGIPYLRYALLHYIIKNLDTTNEKVLRTEEYHRELLINNVITVNVAEKRKALLPKKSTDASLAIQPRAHNESFWKTYNVIKENPLDRKIAEYFEKSEAIDRH